MQRDNRKLPFYMFSEEKYETHCRDRLNDQLSENDQKIDQ
jgi:hypothetical protein